MRVALARELDDATPRRDASASGSRPELGANAPRPMRARRPSRTTCADDRAADDRDAGDDALPSNDASASNAFELAGVERPHSSELHSELPPPLVPGRICASTAARAAAPAPLECPNNPILATSTRPYRGDPRRFVSRTDHSRHARRFAESAENAPTIFWSATLGAITTTPWLARCVNVLAYRSVQLFHPMPNATTGNGPGRPGSALGTRTTAGTLGVIRRARSRPRRGQKNSTSRVATRCGPFLAKSYAGGAGAAARAARAARNEARDETKRRGRETTSRRTCSRRSRRSSRGAPPRRSRRRRRARPPPLRRTRGRRRGRRARRRASSSASRASSSEGASRTSRSARAIARPGLGRRGAGPANAETRRAWAAFERVRVDARRGDPRGRRRRARRATRATEERARQDGARARHRDDGAPAH